MLWKTKFLKIFLSLLVGIFAVYVGQEIFRSFYFFLETTVSVSLFYFIFVLSSIAYLYLIIGLMRLRKWAGYLFSSTILLAFFLSIYTFLSEGADIKIKETIIRAIPGAWLVICIIIIIRYIGLLILRRIRIARR